MVELFILMGIIFKGSLNKVWLMVKEFYFNKIRNTKDHLKITFNMDKDSNKVNYINLKEIFLKDLKYLVI